MARPPATWRSTWALFGDYSATGARTVAKLLLIDDDPALIPRQVRPGVSRSPNIQS